ncbi:integrase/recombinase XerD [Rhodococcus sp. OAS809]
MKVVRITNWHDSSVTLAPVVTQSGMNQNHALDEFEIWQYAQSMSQRTVIERSAMLRRCARDLSADPTEFTPHQLASWLANQSWSASTRATYFGHLSAWHKWLQRTERRVDDPMIHLGRPRRPRGEPHPVSDEHMPILVETRMHKKTMVMVYLGALQGLRAHEIAKIRGEEVDVVGGTLKVQGKGGVFAILPLHPEVARLAADMPRKGWWFPSRTDPKRPMRPKSVTNTLKALMVRADVPNTGHSLRHWFGTTLVDSGTDLRTTQELMRHASLADTQKYVRVRDKRKTEAIGRLQLRPVA